MWKSVGKSYQFSLISRDEILEWKWAWFSQGEVMSEALFTAFFYPSYLSLPSSFFRNLSVTVYLSTHTHTHDNGPSDLELYEPTCLYDAITWNRRIPQTGFIFPPCSPPVVPSFKFFSFFISHFICSHSQRTLWNWPCIPRSSSLSLKFGSATKIGLKFISYTISLELPGWHLFCVSIFSGLETLLGNKIRSEKSKTHKTGRETILIALEVINSHEASYRMERRRAHNMTPTTIS